VHSPLTLYATLLSPLTTLSHDFTSASEYHRKGYIHVVQTSGYNTGNSSGAHIKVSGADGVEIELKEGDGAYMDVYGNEATVVVENLGDKVAEVLLFDLQ